MVDIAARNTQQTKKAGRGEMYFRSFQSISFLEEEVGIGTQKSWETKHQTF